jgi:hypothetical protein
MPAVESVAAAGSGMAVPVMVILQLLSVDWSPALTSAMNSAHEPEGSRALKLDSMAV